MTKIVAWTPDIAKKQLSQRLRQAKEDRRRLETEWQYIERTLYASRSGFLDPNQDTTWTPDGIVSVSEPDSSDSDYGINYTFKNFRFIHSQLASNPPSVAARPTSSDPSDRAKADCAERLNRHALRQYKFQDLFDRSALHCLQGGTSFIKYNWNPDKGELLDFDESTGEVQAEGDMEFTVPSYWDIFLDPDATCWDEVRYVFERLYMPYEEALIQFPDKKEQLEQFRRKEALEETNTGYKRQTPHKKYDVVELYQYWETGNPVNGMVGRFCYHLPDGTPITEVSPSPCRFPPPYDKKMNMSEEEYERRKNRIARAYLPYSVFTDIDVPGKVWGRSHVAYGAPLQELTNRAMSASVDSLQAHGIPRLILPEGTEIADDSITNSPWDIVRITGNQPPYFRDPIPLPAGFAQIMEMGKEGINDLAGVNESMFGQQSRETSGFSMQYATSQGNMIRRRLFNKYIAHVEEVYKGYLNLVRKYWTNHRTILVLGQEKAFESIEIQGADINGGFDLVVEYGTSLSLDPITRRQEILTYLPLFEKAGVDNRTILRLLNLNDLSGLFDRTQLAYDRQREIFSKMIKTGEYIPPRELQDHPNMLSYAYEYVMTAEFNYLPEDRKHLIESHIRAREQMAAQGAAAAGGAPPASPAPAPGPGAAPLIPSAQGPGPGAPGAQ